MVLLFGIAFRLRNLATVIREGRNRFLWPIDAHCPLPHEQVFPEGIPGVQLYRQGEFPKEKQPPRGPATMTIQQAWFIVWESLHLPVPDPAPTGIHFRGFRPRAASWEEFQPRVVELAEATTGPVAVLADSRRDEIAAILGPRAVPQESPPMSHDLDRSPEQTLLFLRDWARFLTAPEIITNDPTSSMVWPHPFFHEH